MTVSIARFLTLIGLCFDVIGAWYISRGIMKKTEEELIKETGFSFGPNNNYIISGLKQKVEGDFGFFFLLVGFSLQGISSLLNNVYFTKLLSIDTVIICFISLIVLIALTLIVTDKIIRSRQKVYVKKHVYKVVEEHIRSNGDKPKQIQDIIRLLNYIGIVVSDSISQDEAWTKLKENVKQ